MSKTNELYNWLPCPICKGKTRTMLRRDTVLINFPLFCPKRKSETLINANKLNITVITDTDA
ncbi:MAG: cysteine-rich KTR domain-containing protein [Oscillospiraceae bacterium]|nr:cysteine-rich KTR domain-containing protein [Oscillospiraceae bacterium]